MRVRCIYAPNTITTHGVPVQHPYILHNPTDPFHAGYQPTPAMGFEPDQPESHIETVNEFKDHMKASLGEAKSALAKAKDDMARYNNQC